MRALTRFSLNPLQPHIAASFACRACHIWKIYYDSKYVKGRGGECEIIQAMPPTKQAYLAIHQTAELAKALKIHRTNEIHRILKERAERIAAAQLAKQSSDVLGSS